MTTSTRNMWKWHTECDRGIVRHKRSIFGQRLFLFIFSIIVSCQSSVNCWVCFCSCSAFIIVFCQNSFKICFNQAMWLGPVSGNREVWIYILYLIYFTIYIYIPYIYFNIYHLSYYTARLGEVSLSQEGLTAVLERMEVERTGDLLYH